MQARTYIHVVNLDLTSVAQYSVEVSIADMIMSDGKSIESVGVLPDERILPTPTQLIQGQDPVLARAAALAGIEITPEEAGKIFPFQWPKERAPEID